ncbi:hypothetical protein P154DRAFT_523371 [Amniculicola lignicola CBS 123094]|uniref:Uncharacterized protein n=1 Tax=Amniculicola lignicola CBS 123094 TaxID=1392246 RepID=A0A6A5WP16_9PLEO|nr:hypothetical protein P154DRAFT_523371 [Amniculicola lignicola CBS 123094]
MQLNKLILFELPLFFIAMLIWALYPKNPSASYALLFVKTLLCIYNLFHIRHQELFFDLLRPYMILVTGSSIYDVLTPLYVQWPDLQPSSRGEMLIHFASSVWIWAVIWDNDIRGRRLRDWHRRKLAWVKTHRQRERVGREEIMRRLETLRFKEIT